jgi:hypothetical protein
MGNCTFEMSTEEVGMGVNNAYKDVPTFGKQVISKFAPGKLT